MADRNDHTGGLVKKLLFPAAASGANDTFRANDNVNSDDGTTSSSSDRTSPTTSTTKQQQQPTTTTTDPRKFPIEETAHDAITPVTGPPRFFSSTHPTAASEADGHKKKSGSSRVVSHWQTQQKESPQKQNGENSNLQTPARAPPSPPPLDRCLETPASDIYANQELEEQYQCEEESAQDSPFDETEIDNDDSLQFLKQFKAKHDKQSPHKISGADNDDAETEVHNNTTAYHQFRKQQIQHQQTGEVDEEHAKAASEVLSRQLENAEAESQKKIIEEEEQDETTEKCPTNDEKQTPNTPLSTTNKSDEDCTDKDLHGYDHKASPHNAMEYPSYYDNPYHNPLVASALKPNDLFRNPANDDDDGDDSDVDSNASEMGTVINAPNLFASRFSEVDAMERENDNGGFGFDVDDDNHHHDDIILDDEDDDPVITNYKAFRAHDNDDDDENDVDTVPKDDDSATTDPFQTPSMPANREQDTKIGEQQLGDRVAKNEPSAFDENDKHHTPDTMAEQGEHHRVDSGRDSRAQTTEFESKQPLHHQSVNKVLWKKEDGQEGSSSSDIDSEIDQLVRRSASESSAGGIVKSCSSNNSADIFRAPSAGSDHGSSRRIHATNHQPKHSNGNIIPPNRIPPRKLGEAVNKKEEEKKEDLQEKFQQQGSPSSRISPKDEIQATYSNMFKAEEDPPPLEEESGGNPASNLANTIRRIGSKLTKKTSPSNRYFFDIEDEVDEDNSVLEQSQTDNHLDQSQNDNDFQERNSASAPTTPRQQRDDKRQQQQQHYQNSGNHHYSLSKIQEAFPQSPGKESTTSSQVDSLNAPASFLLRSPGSSARLMADFRRESSGTSGNGSSPENENDKHKFGFLKQRIPSILQSASSASLGTGPTPRATGGGRRDQFRNNQPITPSRGANALRYARGCLSFDTTTDQQYDYDFERETAMFEAAADGAEEITSSKSFDARHQRQSSPMRTSKAFRQRFMGFRDEDVKKTNSTQALYGSSRSWDVKSGVASSLWSAAAGVGDGNKDDLEQPAAVHLDASAFRNAPYVRQRNKLHHPHPNGFNNNNGQKIVSGERQHRLRLMSDTNTLPSQNRETLEVLQTPQRIEIEREDALNLLACLCERGVSLYPREDSDISKHSTSQGKPSKDEEMGVENEGNSTILTANDRHEQKSKESPDFRHRKLPSELEPETIDAVVEALRKRSGAEFTPTERKDKGMTPPSEPDQEMIVHVLDELRRSHIYAHEMKRASLSASAWLRSIGHSASSSEGMYYQVSQGSTKTGARQAAGEREGGVEHSSGDSNNDTVDLLTVKAMLHQVQIEAREKEAEAKRLNEELSKCRAEIGRLKSESRSKSNNFASPNRSILDDEEDDESAVSSNNVNAENDSKPTNEKQAALTRNNTDEGRIADESFVDLDSSLLANGEDGEVVRETDQPIARELVMFKSALSDANAVIKQLHSELREANPDGCNFGREPPIIEVSEKAFSRALVDETQLSPEKDSNTTTDQDPDRRTINVRMLDGENFVTDWTSLNQLPPAPDHGLRSPIVGTLLEQWTADRALHNSLLSWMERVMSGEDTSSVPPLTLSSLDHQVRDGFTMHVLPLLLRRSDIRVDVKTRAHRTTAYDIAVSVKSVRPRAPVGPIQSGPYFEKHETKSAAKSVTHSAVTDHIRNGFMGPDHYAEVGSTAASYATGASSSTDGMQQQQGLMSALGGALGGLLSRRKQPASSYYDAELPANSSYEVGSAVGAPSPGVLDYPPSSPGLASAPAEVEDTEPYHRLVSAPPGRIGVSFVEFRGHAVVSDVSQDSPLLGWIFPSDILIAIDEVPVSGMRLRDIIKVLQGRSERQRALRVISSHAMNEFTLNASGQPL